MDCPNLGNHNLGVWRGTWWPGPRIRYLWLSGAKLIRRWKRFSLWTLVYYLWTLKDFSWLCFNFFNCGTLSIFWFRLLNKELNLIKQSLNYYVHVILPMNVCVMLIAHDTGFVGLGFQVVKDCTFKWKLQVPILSLRLSFPCNRNTIQPYKIIVSQMSIIHHALGSSGGSWHPRSYARILLWLRIALRISGLSVSECQLKQHLSLVS